MNSLLQNGLLGMGGIGGMMPQPGGLLGQYYDPDAARKATLKNMLIMGGLGLAGDGWQGAARGAGLAAMETPKQFRDMAMDAYSMDRQSKEDEWRNSEREREIMDRQNRDVMMNGMDPKLRQYYELGGPGLAGDYMRATDPAFRTAGNRKSYAPIPYDMGGGKIGWGIPDEDGNFTPVQSPEGSSFLSPYDKAYQTKAGGNAADQITSAPGDISAADTALALLDTIETDPNMEWGTGFSSNFNAVRGTPGFNFEAKVEQARSGAFLTAIQQLKGMGALSNAEGQTATAAVTRMKTGLGKEAFLDALREYRGIVQRGKAKAEAMLRSAPMPVPGAPATGTGEYTIEEIQ